MYEKYFNQVKLDKARAVVKNLGEKPLKTETTNKVWGESAKPAEMKLYEKIVQENPELLKKGNEKELVDKIYEGRFLCRPFYMASTTHHLHQRL